jgi:hypothetical protein
MSPTMHEMSFWELAKNSPEWVGVFANALFALVTIGVVVWQVRVMKWQGRNSERHERAQNTLIRLQHEHEWMLRINAEREQFLRLGRKLHLAAGCLRLEPSIADKITWEQVQDTAFELRDRLSILDLRAYSGLYDSWYPRLETYVDAVVKAVVEDRKFDGTYDTADGTPNLTTRKTLMEMDESYKPINIFLDIEVAIRMEFFDFKGRWDAELPT